MPEELNLSVPERGGKQSGSQAAVIAVLVLVLAVCAVNLVVLLSAGGSRGRESAAGGLSAEATKQLALKLEKQGLNSAAASVWEDYVARAAADAQERAKVRYRMGKLYQDDGDYAKALENYYRSESLAKVDEIRPEIARRTQECLESLGKFAALRYELADRVGVGSEAAAEGEEVVAEIGAQKITKSQLDRQIESEIEQQLTQLAAFLPPEECRKQKEELLRRFSTSSERLRMLNQFVLEEVLYRRAAESGLADEPAVRDLLKSVRRKVLAQQVVQKELADRIRITPGDLETFYKAHAKDYVQPERAEISHILVKDDATARQLLERLKKGEDFEKLAKEASLDKATADKGGEIPGWAEKGGFIAGIGYSDEAAAAIFSTEAGQVATDLVKTEKGCHVIKVRARQPERQKAFGEVRGEVFRALRAQKEREVQARLLEDLKQRYDVVIHTAQFTGKEDAAGKREGGSAPKSDDDKASD